MTPFLSPSARLLQAHPHVSVSEEDGWWIKGRFTHELETSFELSHELCNQIPLESRHRIFIHPEVPVIYLGLFHDRANLAEFWSGKWVLKPRDLDTTRQIALLCSLLRGVVPQRVAKSSSPPVSYGMLHYSGTPIRS